MSESSTPNLDATLLDCEAVSCLSALKRDDVIAPANNDNRIVFATLSTYADEKDESEFKKILLPPICVPTLDLYNMFYVNKRKAFSPYVMDVLVGALNKRGLVEQILQAYEESSGNSRASLTAQQKILIRQEISVQKINDRVQKIVHLNYDDFADAFNDYEFWFDEEAAIRDASGNITTPGSHRNLSCVDLNVYSDSLQLGFTLIVQFVSWAQGNSEENDQVEFPMPATPPGLIYDNLVPTEENALACNMCVEYTPTSE